MSEDGRPRQLTSQDGMRSALAEGAFVNLQVHPYGSNVVFDATLETQQGPIHAIYKPCRGEAPLWDFPNSTLYKREYAAYLVSQAMGWDFVPLTVVRDGPHGVGSLQLYVEHDPRHNFFTLRASRRKEFERIAAFDVLTNNADRKGGHCLLSIDEQHIWAIDHGLTFHSVHKLRTVIWDFQGQLIDPTIVEGLKKLQPALDASSELSAALRDLLSEEEINALRARLAVMLETPVYPYPGSRRSVPWPPI